MDDVAFLSTIAVTMRVDAVACLVLRELADESVDTILLKGASFRWLYTPRHPRRYEDVDILIDPRTVEAAERVLRNLGFSNLYEGARPHEEPGYARTWGRPNDVAVDLHTAIKGVGRPPEDAWSVLRSHTAPARVGDCDATVLDLPAQLVHIALHALQHGETHTSSIRDLELALAQVGDDAWERAAALARELMCAGKVGAGMRLVSNGVALAERLNLPRATSVETQLDLMSAPAGARSLAQLASAPTFLERADIVFRRLVPTAAALRVSSALARRGRVGLVLAYAGRPVRVAARLPGAVAALRAARRRAERR